MENLFLSALKGDGHKGAPMWFMRQAGRYMDSYREVRKEYTMEQICHSPELSSRIAYDAAKYLQADAAIIFSDIMIPLENLGYNVRYVENMGPIPEKTGSSTDQFVSYSGMAVRNFKDNYPDMPIIGFVGGPLTLASYIIAMGPDGELKKTKEALIRDENKTIELLGELTDVVIKDVKDQISSGADAIQIFDSWLGFLDHNYAELAVEKTIRKIVDAIKKSKVKSIYFSTGTSGMIDVLNKSGADFLSLDWRCSLKEVSETFGNIGLQGNLDPSVLALSPGKAVEKGIQIAREMRDVNKFIFNLGHGILPETKQENVRMLVRKIRDVV